MYLDDIAIELFQRPNPEAKLFGFVLSNLCVVSPEMMEIEFQEIEVTELSTLCIYDLKSTKLFRNRFIQLNFLSLSSLASNIQILVADEFGKPIDKTVKDVPRDFIDHEYEEIVEFVRDLGNLIGIRSTTGSFYNLNEAPHLNLRSLKPCKITRIST